MHLDEQSRRRPFGVTDYEYVNAGRSGTFWQARDGMVVHVAAAEPGRAPGGDAAFVWYMPLVALLNHAWQR